MTAPTYGALCQLESRQNNDQFWRKNGFLWIWITNIWRNITDLSYLPFQILVHKPFIVTRLRMMANKLWRMTEMTMACKRLFMHDELNHLCTSCTRYHELEIPSRNLYEADPPELITQVDLVWSWSPSVECLSWLGMSSAGPTWYSGSVFILETLIILIPSLL